MCSASDRLKTTLCRASPSLPEASLPRRPAALRSSAAPPSGLQMRRRPCATRWQHPHGQDAPPSNERCGSRSRHTACCLPGCADQLATLEGARLTPAAVQGQRLVDSLSKPGSIQRVLRLHFEAFWAAHGRKVLAVLGAVVVYYMW